MSILGSGFGGTQGTSSVTFNGVPASVLSWSDASITARVPVIATPNGEATTASVLVTVAGKPIGSGSFAVIRGILFVSDRDGNAEIYVMNPDGTSQVNLTNHPAYDDFPLLVAGWNKDRFSESPRWHWADEAH